VRPDSFRPPLTLEGTHVRLVPLEPGHLPQLHRAARDPEVSQFMFFPPGPALAQTEQYLSRILEGQAAGTDLAFATVTRRDGEVVGATRFMRIDRENDSVEIGGTFVDRGLWRTAVNTESKYLLLRHAFSVERAHRVMLETDLRNERSQAAIGRLGALREGILRGDRKFPNGTYRSSVIFSILSDEWPSVERRLRGFLARPWPGEPSPGGTTSR
jgi:RimJ/RimL family protein N-acetyltransferase